MLSELPQLDLLTIQADEHVDIIDFTDLAKLVSGSNPATKPAPAEEPEVIESKPSTTRKNRPSAGDFFEVQSPEAPTPSTAKSDINNWRRTSLSLGSLNKRTDAHTAEGSDSQTAKSVLTPSIAQEVDAFISNAVRPTGVMRGIPSVVDGITVPINNRRLPEWKGVDASEGPQSAGVSSGNIRSPRLPPPWREGSLSALDDTMSRIKGALSGLQAKDSASEIKASPVAALSSPKITVVDVRPPALVRSPSTKGPIPEDAAPPVAQVSLRARIPLRQPVKPEVFDVTAIEPPRSPKPVWNVFLVKIPPKKSTIMEPMSKKQKGYTSLPVGNVRWDIVSFSPVEGPSKRDLNRDAALFMRYSKNKLRTRVSLPKRRLIHSTLDRRSAEAPKALSPTVSALSISPPAGIAAKVNLPAPRTAPVMAQSRTPWALGRSGKASRETTWRKQSNVTEMVSLNDAVMTLETVSRSPPPELALSYPPPVSTTA